MLQNLRPRAYVTLQDHWRKRNTGTAMNMPVGVLFFLYFELNWVVSNFR